jgi:SnoaL-like polyketide cyclase
VSLRGYFICWGASEGRGKDRFAYEPDNLAIGSQQEQPMDTGNTSLDAPDADVPPALELFYRAIAQKDIALLQIAVTSDWEYIPAPAGAGVGPDIMVPIFSDLTVALPDMQIVIQDTLVRGNKAAIRARITGTQSGAFMGIAATSKRLDFAIHSFHELRDGQIAKTWHLEDWLTVFHQLDKLPADLSSYPFANSPLRD